MVPKKINKKRDLFLYSAEVLVPYARMLFLNQITDSNPANHVRL